MAKAKKSVNEVTVIAQPALDMVRPKRSFRERWQSVGLRLLKHCMVTNMSSMPMPRRRKGMMLWRGPYARPQRLQKPYAKPIDMPTLARPISER